MAFDVSDTIAAIASARGGAARGIVRISGPNTFHCVASRWAGPSAAIERDGTARCVSGEWRLPHERRLPCQIYLWPNERSYTRQPTAEIHTLGCDPILDILLGQVCQSGARLANAGEFTLRAFLAGRLDLPQAEAVLGVIDSDNQQQLSIALGQLAGGLSKPLNQLRNQLLDLCADVEAGLDFVDEHIEFVSPEDIIRTLDRILNALIELRTQIGSRSLSAAIPKALICGRPNVGKSSLWNALLRNSGESAIVSDIAGTTRDFLEATLGLEGTSCVLVDTAGLDEQLASLVDRESQRLSHAAIDRADCVVLCLDGSRSLHDWEVKGLQSSTYDLVVVNKVDLPTQSFLASLKTATNQIATTPWGWTISDATANRSIELLAVSAEAKQGLDQIRKRLNRHFQELSPDELKVCGSTAARCQSCVERSITAVRRAQQVTAADVGQELLAAELREALDGLAEVAGEVYTDDILDRVFSRFCIGK